MISLLRDDDAGFPDDFLAARLRGRRQARLSALPDQHPSLAAEETIATDHEAEVRWLYRQTTGKTRAGVAPLFVLFELQRLTTWLRHAAAGERREERPDDYFARSLWHQALRRQWSSRGGARDGHDLLAILEKRAVARVSTFKGVSRVYQPHNLAAVERRLTGAVLVHGATTGASAVCREHCRALIDCGNVTALAKAWLWKLPACPPSMPAGHLTPAQLERIWREGDVARLGLPATVSKTTINPGLIAALQAEKKKALWKTIRRRASESSAPMAQVLDYLYLLEAETVKRRERHNQMIIGQ